LAPEVADDPRYLAVDPRTRSEIAAPLLLAGDCLGVINVESRRANAFSDADLDLLETLASRAATALHNARLHAAEREQRQFAETLRDIALSLAAELNPDAILDVLLDHVARVAPYDTASIMLLDPHTHRVRMDRARGYERLGLGDRADRFTLHLDDYANLARMAATRRPHVVPDTHADAFWVPGELAAHIGSWAGAPIVARGQLLGFLSLDKFEAGFYTAEMADRLAAFAAAAGLALENARLYAEQQRLAVTDGLTGIANRRQFDSVLARELLRAVRYSRPLALILLDLDDFKRFNDRYGHPAGDGVMRALALVLAQSLRAMDLAARYGGEEYAVILPETDGASACQVAEHLRQMVAQLPLAPQAGASQVTISLGVAVAPEHGATPDDLVRAADAALYEAKRLGKNRVCFASGGRFCAEGL
jgi:diguanylate cyclase (GGDEF)-like protein